MQVDKFKLKDGFVLVDYSINRPDGEQDSFTLKSKDQPTKELKDKLQSLSKFVTNICEQKEDSISHSFDGDGGEVLGAVIIAKKDLRLSTGVLNLITPHRIDHFYSEHGDEGQLMDTEMHTICQDLEKLIRKYIDGDRAYKQEELFPKEDPQMPLEMHDPAAMHWKPATKKALMESVRDICPKEGSSIDSITFKTEGHEPVTLTSEDRKRMNEKLKQLNT